MRKPDESAGAPLLERLPIAVDRPGLATIATLALVAAALVARFAADPLFPTGFPYVTFFPVVILASALFGARQGLLSGVLGGLLSWYFFIGAPDRFELGSGIATALGFYALVVGTDVLIIHWMQRANAKLAAERERSRALADTRELLFRELQHRVSNNLQVVAALLSLQKRQVGDAAARAALDEASRRMAVIGRISRQLYDPSGRARDVRSLLEPLCADVVDASGRKDVEVRVTCAADEELAPDAAIPMALIVAESVANAIEHGFAGRDGGRIEVELSRGADGGVVVEVRDDGHGVPDGFAIDQQASLGLRIAAMLAEQLRGSFALIGGAGTTARLVLPATS
ncbi:sensor histidine kinase [Sphingomonas japonica]|uniref:histidine kinase n=1 Tax=Sphingomonas japonica TaxID=511662 RepID=A0ABX0U1D6_9SPHN|nr:sensor histidine kinase [Sphingomonas japonica]NIJ23511.1 two-component sensor histidine kinase [Sphingomonas japonica]